MEWIITREVRERVRLTRRLNVKEKLTKKHEIVLTVAVFGVVNSAKNIKYVP